MRGRDVVNEVKRQQTENLCFIKWWSKEKDFVDFELTDTFVGQAHGDEVIDGFELLDMERMWQVFTGLNPDNLSREKRNGDEVIRWVWFDKDGTERVNYYPFTPEGLKKLIDTDFFA